MAAEAQRAPMVVREQRDIACADRRFLDPIDPHSPDREILEGCGRAMAIRRRLIGPDDIDNEEGGRLEDDLSNAELMVERNVAQTIPGVMARLLLQIPSIDGGAFAEQVLCEGGPYALYEVRGDIDGRACQVAEAVSELTRIEWESNLAAYEQANADLDAVIDLCSATCGGEGDAVLVEVERLGEQLKDRFLLREHKALQRLVKTLAPDFDAYRRKAEIAIAEELGAEAAPWLLRDVNYLTGPVEAPDTDASDAED